MENKTPATREDYFALLDTQLSDEQKQDMTHHSAFDYHFSLGMWIRNKWIHTAKEEDLNRLICLFDEETAQICLFDEDTAQDPYFKKTGRLILFDPDHLSTLIIEQYIEYLKAKQV